MRNRRFNRGQKNSKRGSCGNIIKLNDWYKYSQDYEDGGEDTNLGSEVVIMIVDGPKGYTFSFPLPQWRNLELLYFHIKNFGVTLGTGLEVHGRGNVGE